MKGSVSMGGKHVTLDGLPSHFSSLLTEGGGYLKALLIFSDCQFLHLLKNGVTNIVLT